MHHTQPLLLPANKEGYTVLATSQSPEDLPSLAWRLNLLSQYPLQGLTQLPSSRQDIFEGEGACRDCCCMFPAMCSDLLRCASPASQLHMG